MEHDQLTCDKCGLDWQRPKTRGRKPKLCPTCLQSPEQPTTTVDNTETKKTSVNSDNKMRYKPNTEWKCHSCGAYVKICIAINEPPSHSCNKRLKKVYDLELIK